MAASNSWRSVLAFAAGAAGVSASFALAVAGIGRWQTWQAESFGDRRLATPSPVECEIVRAVLADREPDKAALLKGVGASDVPMGFRAFAWWSSGQRIPPGADWRKCPGLGPYIRGLGMARFASGELGPMLYVSRVRLSGGEARVFETFSPPRRLGGVDVEARLSGAVRSWEVSLVRSAGGWRVVGRKAATPPP